MDRLNQVAESLRDIDWRSLSWAAVLDGKQASMDRSVSIRACAIRVIIR